MAGGTASLQFLSGDMYTESTEISLSGFGGYFIKPRILIGGLLQYAYIGATDWNSSFFAVGPWAAYTFKSFQPGQEVRGALIPFAKLGFALRTFGMGGDEWKNSSTGFMIPVGGGFFYMLSPSLALTAELCYSIDHTKDKNAEEGLGGGRLVLSVGLAFFKGK